MAATGIEYIQESIRQHFSDLHMLFKHDAVNIDQEYFNEVCMALLAAEDAIKIATQAQNARMSDCKRKYETDITSYIETIELKSPF